MKLTQFKTRASNQQRLGVAVGDVVCDVAELAQALEAAGAGPASWLLEAKDMLDVIGRGESALGEISALLIGRRDQVFACRTSEQDPGYRS